MAHDFRSRGVSSPSRRVPLGHVRQCWVWSLMVVCLSGQAHAFPDDRSAGFAYPVRQEGPDAFVIPQVPLESVPARFRDGVARVLEKPTLAARGTTETFTCQPSMYYWLLDNPHHSVHLWRQMGAKTTDVEDRGNGRFGYRDANGTDVWWETVVRAQGLRVWYSEGVVRPGMFLPKAHVEVIVICQHQQGRNEEDKPAMRHQMHLLVKTDSKVVTLAARLLGGSAPKLAEQYMGQMQMFFGALAWYLDQDEERARRLFKAIGLLPGSGP
jgi:hypothetical protein